MIIDTGPIATQNYVMHKKIIMSKLRIPKHDHLKVSLGNLLSLTTWLY